jgi:hypothetical protein
MSVVNTGLFFGKTAYSRQGNLSYILDKVLLNQFVQYSRSRRADSYSGTQKITQHFIKHASSLPHSQGPNSETHRSHIKLFHDRLPQFFNEMLSMNLRKFVTANPFSKSEALCNISYHIYAPFCGQVFPIPKLKDSVLSAAETVYSMHLAVALHIWKLSTTSAL